MKNFSKTKTMAVTIILIFICFCTCIPYAYAQEDTKYVYIGGESFGLKMFTKGAVVINLESFESYNNNVCPAKETGLKVNDSIISVENNIITDNENLENIIRNSNGDTLTFTVERNDEILNYEITPEKDKDGIYKIGAWIRDSCSGIGTITYYDEENKIYAGLGHGICDIDTKKLMNLDNGSIYEASIINVSKAYDGSPGTLNGYLGTEELGSLDINTELGIYGNYSNYNINKEKVEIAQIDNIKKDTVTILTTIDDTGVQEFEAEIISFCDASCNNNKNFVIEITDKELLSVTGGIVQGMSGSPVLQNGKLVGAVNHVFINSPEKGYCVFAQNMVSNYENNHNILY